MRHYERVSNDHEVAFSRILSGEVDSYEPKSENAPVPPQSISKQESSSAALFPGIQYNNCTVNVFGSGNPPPTDYVSAFPPFPPPFYSTTPYYPEFSMPSTSYSSVNESDF